jgi:REP element-mobilizing transposase RayT
MSSTYHQVYVQAVFAVKYRAAMLEKDFRPKLFPVIGNLINETGCKCMIVNGWYDHVHCLFSVKPSITISNVMKSSKAKSSKWINESNFFESRFEWQTGFGAFSYGKDDIDKVYQYIKNQEEHHAKIDFKTEYRAMLIEHGIEFKEEYLFDDLI